MAGGFFRELKHYTVSETAGELGTSLPEAGRLLGILKKYGIVKAVRASKPEYENLSNQDIILTDVSENETRAEYVFDFVGVVTLEKYVIKCYPKYITSTAEPMGQLKKVLKVIRKYNDKEQTVPVYHGGGEDGNFNWLGVALYLLEDYFRYGLYASQLAVIESNGQGEILWDRTISETTALIRNNRPYYVEFRTRGTAENENDYCRRLHACILTRCCAELKENGILELFDIGELELNASVPEDFGEADFILYRLERELRQQYVTRKQILLKTLYSYIAGKNVERQESSLGLYGTNSFNLVWERVCGDAFGNMREKRLGELPCGISGDFASDRRLIDLIDRPLWHRQNPPGTDAKSSTFLPDILCIHQVEDTDEYCFGIYDAKYYCMEFRQQGDGCKVVGQPGVEDVAKQYLYRMAYEEFIEAQGFRHVWNMFLFPQEKTEPEYAWVEMKMFRGPIIAAKLCAEEMYDLYLADRKIKMENLELIWNMGKQAE